MATRTWTGAFTTSWFSSFNWSGNTAPGSGDTAVIPGGLTNYPVISTGGGTSNVTIAVLTVQSGGQLTINSSNGTTRTLTLSTSGSNAGTITLHGTSSSHPSTLTVSGASGFSNTGTITATGYGALSGGSGGIANNGGTISVTANTLTVSSAITDTNSASISVSSGATLTTNSALTNTSGTITVNGTLTETGNTQISNAGTISIAGGTLSDTGTGGVSNTGTINSSGTSALNVGATHTIANAGGQINVTGGTLTVTGALTDTSSAQINISSGATLTSAYAITNTSGTITVNGMLTETGNTQISNAGTITLSGGTLSDTGTGGISNSGTISASGTAALNVGATHAIGNTGAIHVTGGTLTVTGLITDTGSSTITIDSGATLTTSQLITNTSGTVTLNNGTLTDSGGLTLTAGGLTGYGAVNAAITGGGTITANGGALTLSGQVDASGTASSLIIDNGSTLQLTSTTAVGAASINPTLSFIGNGDLFIDTAAAVGTLHLGAISGFSGTDKIEIKAIGSGDTVSWSAATNKLTISNGLTSQTFTFAAGTQGQYITVSDVSGVDTLTICFMAGTMIRTPDGEVAVETLKPGDLVLTTTGEAKPVNWVGRQTVSKRFADPLRSYPIRVRAGALDDNTPVRDLLISPDHALLVGGVMVQAGALVNGTSITREKAIPDTFVYYHVELDDHSLILAEGAPAETFVDNVDRMNFDNWSEYRALYPNGKTVEELPYPRAKSHRQVPVPLRVALAERALGLGAGDAAEVA
jgi:hypothetical protein